MDANRFDTLAKTLSAATRRDLVRRVLTLPLAGVLATVGLGDETHAKTRDRTDRTARAQACIPTGKRCPAPNRAGGKASPARPSN